MIEGVELETQCCHQKCMVRNSPLEIQYSHLHRLLVPTRSSIWYEGKTPSGSVVKCHANTPQVYIHSIGFLMRFTQHSTFIHVGVLHTDTHTFYERKDRKKYRELDIKSWCLYMLITIQLIIGS